MEVLEEGVGYVDLALVAYKVPDGRIILGAGPTQLLRVQASCRPKAN